MSKVERPTINISPQPKQMEFLESDSDIVIFGGAAGGGKSWSILCEPFHDIGNPQFGAVIFRRTYPQIMQQGGLWDISEEIYPSVGARPNRGDCSWIFPSKSTVSFRHMENEDDRYKYDGAQIPLIEFDQLESFTAKQFFYMMSRNRSMSGAKSRMRASANPQPGWLADFLQWWWDEKTGYAIPERSGKKRWFVRIGDAIKWSDSKSSLIKKYPKSMPKSVEFILSKLQDNQILMDKDPSYLASLMALPLVDRERLLGGNWKIAIAGNIFRREWWKFCDRPPSEITDTVRFWDCAATEPKEGKDPDWTAGVKMAKDKQGNAYVLDVQHFRGTPLTVERRIVATAELDSTLIRIRMEQEGGSSGKSMIDYWQRSMLFGYDFAGVPSLKKKVMRWAPLSAACEQGRVYLVRAHWNQDFIDELEGCKGEEEKNDQADAASGAMNELAVGTGAFGSASEMGIGRVNLSSDDAITFSNIDKNFF